MAKTMASIQIDFRKTIQKAEELDQLARQLENLAKGNFEGILQDIGRTWTGEASIQYRNKGRILEESMKEKAEQLRSIADSMRTVARETYNAEKRAIQIAGMRK